MSDKNCEVPREDCVEKWEVTEENQRKILERLIAAEKDIDNQGKRIMTIGDNVAYQDKLCGNLSKRLAVLEFAEASRLVSQKKYDFAITHLDLLLGYDVANSYAWHLLVWTYLFKGEKKKALDTVDKALANVTENTRPIFNDVKFGIMYEVSSYEDFRLYLNELKDNNFVVFDKKRLG